MDMCPASSGSERTWYAEASFLAISSRVIRTMRMFEIGSEVGSREDSGYELRQTTHCRSAPRWSQPPLLVVQS